MKYPTIKQLRYYIALVENNHFGKAAESCFVSQSAFSVAIKELELSLNGRLVDRTNKSVTVTSLGKDIYKQAKITIQELTQLIEISKGNNKPFTGKLALGIIPTIAPFVLPGFVPNLQKKYKNLELYLDEDMTKNLYEKLMEGDLDVILVALPYAMKNVETLTLFKDDFYLAYCSQSKWIDTIKNKVNPKIGSVLLLEDGHCMRDHALSACDIKQYDKISHYTATSMLTLVEMVKNDMGVTFLPKMSLLSPLVKDSNLKIIQQDINSYRNIGLVWRKGSLRENEFTLLGDFIRKSVS